MTVKWRPHLAVLLFGRTEPAWRGRTPRWGRPMTPPALREGVGVPSLHEALASGAQAEVTWQRSNTALAACRTATFVYKATKVVATGNPFAFVHLGRTSSAYAWKLKVAGRLDSMANQTAAFIDALHLVRPDLLGWSMGTAVVQALAVLHPSDVGALVLCAPYPGNGAVVLPPPSVLNAETTPPPCSPPTKSAPRIPTTLPSRAIRRRHRPLRPPTAPSLTPSTSGGRATTRPEGWSAKSQSPPSWPTAPMTGWTRWPTAIRWPG